MSFKSGFQAKLILVGEPLVGKTSIRQRYMGAGFRGSYLTTIGSDFASKSVKLGDTIIHLQIWDLAGHDMFRSMRPLFYKGAQVVLLVFDTTDRASFERTHDWLKECFEIAGETIRIVALIGNKIDLEEFRVIAREEGIEATKRIQKKYGVPSFYIETSALTGENIELLFNKVSLTLIPESILPKIFEKDPSLKELYESDQEGTRMVETANSEMAQETLHLFDQNINQAIMFISMRLDETEKNLEKVQQEVKKLNKSYLTLSKQLEDLFAVIRKMDTGNKEKFPKLKLNEEDLSFLEE